MEAEQTLPLLDSRYCTEHALQLPVAPPGRTAPLPAKTAGCQPDMASCNAVSKSARRVYSAEELHRLRSAQSQPKLQESIEERDGEDAELVKGKHAP